MMSGDGEVRPSALPVTIVTGFLGSGKTTFLNHVLTGGSGARVGVIVNEFGAINIDSRLIARASGDVVELTNGCVCCTVQKDLLATVGRLLRSESGFDYLLIETTGLADPAPVATSLARPELAGVVRLDAIVTVVDAARFDENLDQAEAAYSQLAHADVLLLNKTDLVEEHLVEAMRRGLRTVNRSAPIVTCVQAGVDLGLLLDLAAGQPARPREGEGAEAGVPGHDHGHFESLAFRGGPLDRERFHRFVDQLPGNVVRAKGIAYFAGMAEPVVFHRVGQDARFESAVPAGTGEHATELVFIGRRLDRETLLSRLRACCA